MANREERVIVRKRKNGDRPGFLAGRLITACALQLLSEGEHMRLPICPPNA